MTLKEDWIDNKLDNLVCCRNVADLGAELREILEDIYRELDDKQCVEGEGEDN